jgi:hypothetical protein
MFDNDMQWDVRVVDHRRRRGILNRTDHKKVLDVVEDCTEEAEETVTTFSNNFELRRKGAGFEEE